MNTLAKVNKAKYETAKEILEYMYISLDDIQFEHPADKLAIFYWGLENHIRKEYLFESDYTK